MTTLNFTETLIVEHCCRCGVAFGLPSDLQEQLLKDRGRSFYCPLGHGQVYSGKTEAQKLREQLEFEQRRVVRMQAEQDRLRAERDHESRRRAAAQGQVTKIKKRVGKGTCPCCNRHFENVSRHMASKHPEFHAEVES